MPTSIRLAPETDNRLDRLASQTGRSKAYYLREIIERGLEEMEDYYLAADVLERVRKGEERVRSLDEVERDLGHQGSERVREAAVSRAITPQEFKEQFGRSGYLADMMGVYAHNIRSVSAEWFKLAEDTNECLGAIAVKAMETQRGKIADKNVLSALLLLRSLGMIQGSIKLSNAVWLSRLGC